MYISAVHAEDLFFLVVLLHEPPDSLETNALEIRFIEDLVVPGGRCDLLRKDVFDEPVELQDSEFTGSSH